MAAHKCCRCTAYRQRGEHNRQRGYALCIASEIAGAQPKNTLRICHLGGHALCFLLCFRAAVLAWLYKQKLFLHSTDGALP